MMKWIFIIFVIVFAYFFLIAGNVGGQGGFDHEQCQYPSRTTNPPDGCDNSDPCDTLDAVKGGSGECKPTTAKISASQNIKTVENAVESVGK